MKKVLIIMCMLIASTSMAKSKCKNTTKAQLSFLAMCYDAGECVLLPGNLRSTCYTRESCKCVVNNFTVEKFAKDDCSYDYNMYRVIMNQNAIVLKCL